MSRHIKLENFRFKVKAIYYSYFYWRSFILNFFNFFSSLLGAKLVLRILGAKIGCNTRIHNRIIIQNAPHGHCSNLSIGNNVYIGPKCLFDLSSKITINNNCAIAADVNFITHFDVGETRLKNIFSRTEGNILINDNVFIGVGCTILNNVNIGSYTIIGAMSLVNKDISGYQIMFGTPAIFRNNISCQKIDNNEK